MATLLEIGDDVKALWQLLEELPDGEMSPEAEAALDSWFAELAGDRDRKLNAYGDLIQEFADKAEARRQRAELLYNKAVAAEKVAAKLKGRVLMYMDGLGLKRLSTELHNFTAAVNGGSPQVRYDEDKVPYRYKKWQCVLDRSLIQRDIAAGASVPGVTVLPRGKHLLLT